MSNAMEDYRMGCLRERIEERAKRDREMAENINKHTAFEQYLLDVKWRSRQVEEDYE